jgi:hypothetical protein
MGTFLLLLCVLAAIFTVGPLGLAPWYGLRGIRRKDADAVEQATKWTTLFGGGATVTGLLGAATLAFSDTYDYNTPWVVIATTLTLVLLALVFLWTVPSLRKGASLLTGRDADPARPAGEVNAQLEAATGRIAAAAGTTLLLIVAIIIMAVTRPFGV